MTTIHLEPDQVPAHLRGGYSGKTFTAQVCEQVTVPIDAGLWSGGSRDTYKAIRLVDGATVPISDDMLAPWSPERQERRINLRCGIAVVEHSICCGKDCGLRFYVHPADAVAMLPAPVDLESTELYVLEATVSFKSSYMGRDRYQMMKERCYGQRFPSRADWETAKESLTSAGYLTKAGAITTKGRNAVSGKRGY